tara:strand:+ start:13 stop:195 length:183 start_codon:yes stop_codon:yes gene_type:complete
METVILKKQNIVIELGGMQVSRETLEDIKAKLETDKDRVAIQHLVFIAEHAVNKYVETYG